MRYLLEPRSTNPGQVYNILKQFVNYRTYKPSLSAVFVPVCCLCWIEASRPIEASTRCVVRGYEKSVSAMQGVWVGLADIIIVSRRSHRLHERAAQQPIS